MQWTMPHRVLQVVASLLALIAIGSFSMGIYNAPSRGRLPGEKAAGSAGGAAAPIEAVEATPLSQERIEGPPPPPELTPEQKAKLEADKQAKADAAAEAEQAAAEAPPIILPSSKLGPPTPAPGDRVGDLLDGVTPPPEDPPH
jgi:hypothetical protein